MKAKTVCIVTITILAMLAACKFGSMVLNSYYEALTNTLLSSF